MEYSHKSILLTSPSRAFGSIQRYIQGPGELNKVFEYGKKYGDRFLFLVDSGVFDMIRSQVEAIEDRCGCECVFHSFYGECCRENIDLLIDVVRESGCNVVLGVGGGKVLDTVKLVADAADLPRIIIPTSASSDAPAADWAAVYDTKGVFLGATATNRNTELVLVDSAIIARAPARLFASGIADALVTWYEAMANERSLTPNNIGRGYLRSLAGMAIARESHDILLRDGIQAYEAVKAKLLTPAVENVIEANILLSGLGFMNAGCACAHGVHNGISALENGEEFLHGEKVAFGLICQLIFENAPQDELNTVMVFLDALNLPVTLEQLHIACNDENLDVIVDYMMNKSLLIHREPFPVTADMVRNIILAANHFGHQFLAGKR
jgi:glycerol dehydrogenase